MPAPLRATKSAANLQQIFEMCKRARIFFAFSLIGLAARMFIPANFIHLFGLFTCGAILSVSRGCYPCSFTPCCLLLAAISASLRSFAEILSGACIFFAFSLIGLAARMFIPAKFYSPVWAVYLRCYFYFVY